MAGVLDYWKKRGLESGQTVADLKSANPNVNFAQSSNDVTRQLGGRTETLPDGTKIKYNADNQVSGISGRLGVADQHMHLLDAAIAGRVPEQNLPSRQLAGLTGQSTSGGISNAQDHINRLNQARQQEVFAQLDKSRTAALGNIADERAGVQPRYYDARNQAAAGSQQQARNFAEFMAARGGTRSGAAAQAELSRQGNLQGNIGSLNQQEQAVYDGLDRQVTQTENAYQADRAAAVAGLEASRMEALINQMNADRQFGLQEAGLTGTIGDQRTIQGQQMDWAMNPENPANVAQNLNNQIAQMKLQNLPRELELGLTALEQDIRTGSLNQQQAEIKLRELQDPNSFTNQSNRLALEAQRLGNQELSRRIAEIGKVPAVSEYERQMQSIRLEAAKLELEQLRNPPQTGMNQEQVNAYNNLLAQYTREGRDPAEALQFASSPQGRLNALNYGLSEGLYNQMVADLQSRIQQPEQPTNNQVISEYVSNLDRLTPEQRELVFQNERANIIRDIGLPGWESLKEMYNYIE